jgi:DNA-binding MarR family transcriptional regulator
VPNEPEIDLADLAAHLRVATARLARRLRQESTDLPPTLDAALATIFRDGPLTLGELAEHERIARPSATRVVQKLEQRDLVTRRTDEDDRRVSWVEVTTAGRKHVEAARRRRTAWLARELRDLPPADVERLAAALGVLEGLTKNR